MAAAQQTFVQNERPAFLTVRVLMAYNSGVEVSVLQRERVGDRNLEILLAQTAGFCMGVRRALKLTLDAANDPASPRPIATVGPLIHNPHVLEVLRDKGVEALEGEGCEGAATAIIRAHGVAPQEHERLAACCQRVIDATCPHVHRVQRIAERYCRDGYHCVVVGDRGHAEVEGVLSYARGRGVVVSRIEDVDQLPPMQKAVVVAQTTQDATLFARVAEKVRQKHPDSLVFDTICRSTQMRQEEARRLAGRVDAMVVVGGFNSANTCRLAAICSEAGTATFHVEADWQLDMERLLQCRRIGVTAGASTPHWMIRRVLYRIRSEHDRRQRTFSHMMRLILRGPIRTNVFIGGGAAAMAFANWRLIPLDGGPLGLCMALAFFFILAQHLLNQYTKRHVIYLSEPEKGEFFRANAGAIRLLGVSSCALAAFIGFLLGWLPFALVLAGSAAGLLYRSRLGGRVSTALHIRRLEQLPGSKELFVAMAWGVTTALVPALAARAPVRRWHGVAVAAAFSFLLAFHRTLLTDLRDVESDQLVGRETMAGLLGEGACKRVVIGVLAAEALLLAGGGLLGWTSAVGYGMLVSVACSAFCFSLFHKGKLPEAELGEALIDATFYACGLVALIGWALS